MILKVLTCIHLKHRRKQLFQSSCYHNENLENSERNPEFVKRGKEGASAPSNRQIGIALCSIGMP